MRRAVAALRPYVRSASQQADLALIEDAVARLSRTTALPLGLGDFDASRLAHLLRITGPELAAELLERLTEDLSTTQDMLAAGVERADWRQLREGSHVLISLSGSVGAISLQSMSESLNAIAHQQNREALTALMPPLSAELASLIQLIRDTRPPVGEPG